MVPECQATRQTGTKPPEALLPKVVVQSRAPTDEVHFCYCLFMGRLVRWISLSFHPLCQEAFSEGGAAVDSVRHTRLAPAAQTEGGDVVTKSCLVINISAGFVGPGVAVSHYTDVSAVSRHLVVGSRLSAYRVCTTLHNAPCLHRPEVVQQEKRFSPDKQRAEVVRTASGPTPARHNVGVVQTSAGQLA